MQGTFLKLLFHFFIFLTHKKVLTLVIISHKEPSLILQVKMWRKSFCIKFGYNFLFQLLIEHLSTRIQLLYMMSRKIEHRGKNHGRSC